jgi:hypothetical protein
MQHHEPATEFESFSARTTSSRMNGAKGRGPTTDDGKTKSSRNALKHGLTARTSLLVNPEDEPGFLRYHSAMFEALAPADEVQATLAEIIVRAAWRLRLFVDIEADYMRDNLRIGGRLHHAFTFPSNDRFAVLNRYQSTIERGMYRAMGDLRKMQQKSAAKPTAPLWHRPQDK